MQSRKGGWKICPISSAQHVVVDNGKRVCQQPRGKTVLFRHVQPDVCAAIERPQQKIARSNGVRSFKAQYIHTTSAD